MLNLNHGDSVKVTLVGVENYTSPKKRQHLVFHVQGTTQTLEHVFMLEGTNPEQGLRIWAEALSRQLPNTSNENKNQNQNAEIPTRKYLKYVKKLTEAQIEKEIAAAMKEATNFESMIGKEFTLWYKVDSIYTNYVPYLVRTNPTTQSDQPSPDDEELSPF